MSEEILNEIVVTGQVDLDGDGVTDITAVDTDGDGATDTVLWEDADTGESLLTHDNADGSSEDYLYDADGNLIAGQYVSPEGEVTELDLGLEETPVAYDEHVGDEDWMTDETVISQVPLQEGDNVCTIDDVTTSDEYRTWLEEQGSVDTDVPTDDGSTVDDTDRSVGDDGFIGDKSDADFWFQQGTAFTCGPASATQIIEDFTGVDYADESTVADYAADKGWLTENGITFDNLDDLLTDFGVPSTTLENQTWDDIGQYLEEGRSVTMFVDATDYWGIEDPDGAVENSDGDVANHAVRIVGIDTVRQVAILSDSGHPDGYQMEVPLSAMEEAWNDVTGEDADGNAVRGHVLVVSDGSDPDAGESVTEGPVESGTLAGTDLGASALGSELTNDLDADSGGLFDNPKGFVIVPVVLAASRIFSAVRAR